MAVKTWSRTVGDANWSTAANWSGGTVPVNADSVVFDATSVLDCTVDALGTFNDAVSVAAGYTGTITQSINISIGTFSIADGTWTKTTQTFTCTTYGVTGGVFNGGSGAMTTGAVTFSAGNLTATSDLWTVSAASFTQTGTPTFSANGGTITFTGGTAATLTAPNLTFSVIDFNKTNVDFAVAAGTTCPLGTSPSCDCGTGTFVVNGVVTWTNTLTLDSPINVSSTGTLTVSGTIRLSVNGSLTFDPAATITASLPLSIVGTNAATITATAYTFATSTISRGSGTLTIAASTTLPLGASPTTDCGVFTINGTVTVSGTWTHSQPLAGGVEITVSSTGTISGALTTLSLSSCGLILNATATFPSNVRLEFIDDITADLTATAHTFAVSIVNKASGGFNLNAGTAITLEGGSNCTTLNVTGTLTISSGATFTADTFNVPSGGTLTTSGSATMAATGAITIDAAATISGSISVLVSVGTATARTIALGGKTYVNFTRSGTGSGTRTITGTNTFTGTFQDNEGSVAHTIVFPNVTTTVGDFIVAGSSGKLVTLSRTGGAGTFTLTKTGGGRIDDCDYLSISNSTVDASPEWYAGANSTDGTGNTNWIFTAPPALGGPRKSIVLM